ncbi:MAG: TonB-dependent receptor [Acidobacteria bacterium]|nr:TonB-dependent receptor [Acidobacteriota bacterium]
MRGLLVIGLLASVLARSPAVGQGGPSRASASGVIYDASGRVVPGAMVDLEGPHGSRVSTESSVDGTFRFDNIAPGRYEISVERSGFRRYTASVRVGARSPAPLEIRLSLAILEQKWDVREPEIEIRPDTSANLDVVLVDRAALDNLPALQNDVLGAISRFLDPAALGTSGPTMVVDGMEGSHMSVSVSAIQEVRINQNPYSAEFFRPGRSRLEIITKVGTPDFHGTFNFQFRDHHLDARNAFAATRPPTQWRSFESSLTGPVGDGKRNSFVVSVNHDQFNQQAVIFARTSAGDVRENAPTPTRNTFISARLSHEIRQGHTITLRHEYQQESNRGQGVGGFTLPEAGANYFDRQNHFYTHHRITLSPHLINEFSTRTGRHNDHSLSVTPGAPRIVVLDAFTGGSAQSNQHRTEIDFQFAEVLSWAAGKHLLKIGGNSYDINRRGLHNLANTSGTFYFSSLDDYRAGRPFTFIQQQGDGHVSPIQKDLGAFIQDNYRARENLSLGFGVRADWQDTVGDHNNVAPRVSFAWVPRKRKRVALRGGAGLFFDRSGTRPVADVNLYSGARLRQIIVENPSYPNPFLGRAQLAAQPISLARFAPGVENPYTVQSGIGVETQLDKSTALTISYTYAKGVKLFRSRDVNAPLPPFTARPDPNFAQIRQFESSGNQVAHSIEVSLRGKITQFFTGTAQYVLSRTYNDASGIYSFPAYNYDTRSEWSRADFDGRHRLAITGTAKAGRWFDAGILFTARTGTPYSLTTGRDDNRDSLAADRPPGVKRNSLQGPDNATLDLRVARDFLLGSSKKEKGPAITLSIESFNLLNRANYVTYVGNLSSPFFGKPVAAFPARRMQAGFRFRF